MLRYLCPKPRELGFYTTGQNFVPTIFYVKAPDSMARARLPPGEGRAGPSPRARRADSAYRRGREGRARPGHAVVATGWGADPARIRAAMAGLTPEQAIAAGRPRSNLPRRGRGGLGFRNARHLRHSIGGALLVWLSAELPGRFRSDR